MAAIVLLIELWKDICMLEKEDFYSQEEESYRGGTKNVTGIDNTFLYSLFKKEKNVWPDCVIAINTIKSDL